MRIGLILGLGIAAVSAGAPAPAADPRAAATAALRRQSDAADDLAVTYTIEQWNPDGKGGFAFGAVQRCAWTWDRRGYEKLVVTETPPPAATKSAGADPEAAGKAPRDEGPAPGVTVDWVQGAAFDGVLYTTYDSQQVGSGSIGHGAHSFLYGAVSPRRFGLDVTGLDMGAPLSVADFLDLTQSEATVKAGASGTLVAEGRDVFREGWRVLLTLDPAVGYRPTRLEFRDGKGPLTLYDSFEYKVFKGARGDFFFPVRAVWHGVNPADRTPGAEMRLKVEDVKVDAHPGRDQFAMTFPKGALVINSDTGQMGYATAATTAADLPNLAGKMVSARSHDLATQKSRPAAAGGGRGIQIALGSVALLCAVVLVALKNRGPTGRAAGA